MKAIGAVAGFLLLVGLVAGYAFWDKIEQGYKGKGQAPPRAVVQLKRVHAKLIYSSGKIGLELLMKESEAWGIDSRAILASIFDGEPGVGLPPRDIPVLMIVNKRTNDVRHWKLTDNVRLIRVRHGDPGEIELRVMNEDPLRVELWFSSEREVEVDIELKEPVTK